MGKYWEKIKNILGGNLTKNLKKIVEKVGIFLISTLQLSIGLIAWLVTFITIGPVAIFAFGVYVAFVECSSFGILKVFKANGNGNGNHLDVPQ